MEDCKKSVTLAVSSGNCRQNETEEAEIEKLDKSRRYGVLALIVINIGLLISLLILVIRWRSMRWGFLEPHEHTICQPCADIGLVGEELPENVQGNISRKKKDGTLECCGKASVMLDWMVEKAVDRRKNDYTGGEMYPLVSELCSETLQEVPSAQVNGLSEFQVAEMREKIHWDLTGSFFKAGIHYKHGKMIVSKPGFYYLFSQTMFKITQQKEIVNVQTYDDQENNTIWHHIYRHSPTTGEKRILLESAKSKCEYQTPTDGVATNFMGAVFRLEEGDELHVYTSHPDSLVQSKEANYFGMYMT